MYKFYLLKLYDFIFASEYALASSSLLFFQKKTKGCGPDPSQSQLVLTSKK